MNVYVLGSSTTTDDYPAETMFPWQGWGYRLNDYFDDTVKVINLAISGWSLKGLVTSKYVPFTEMFLHNKEYLNMPDKSPWAYLIKNVNKGDWVIIGSTAINDKYRKDIPGWTQTPEEYKQTLINCCSQLLELGVNPIIMSGTGAFREEGTHSEEYESVKPEIESYFDGRVKFFDVLNKYFEYLKGFIDNGYTYEQVYDRFSRTHNTLINYYEKYHYLGTEFAPYFKEGAEPYKLDSGHYNIESSLKYSSILMNMIKNSDCPLKEHICRTELDIDECISQDIKCLAEF